VAQQTNNEGGCSVEGAGIVDVIDMDNTNVTPWPIALIAWRRAKCRPHSRLKE
jgi:hypothetical protein